MLKKIIFSLIFFSFILTAVGCGLGTPSDSVISSDVDFGKKDYQKVVSANNQLGLDLLSIAERDQNGNIFISPASLFMALSMVYNGADGTTKEEISEVLKIKGIDTTELNKANASLITSLYQNSKSVQIRIANSIWINEDFHFQPEFSQNTQDYFNAEIEEIDIFDSKSAEMINDWVKKSTNNKIEEIVESPLNPDLVALLINAIYFNGDWKFEFDKKQTKDRTFYLNDGTAKEVPLMSLKENLPYLETEHFQAVSLPYGDEEMSMNVYLPKENTSLAEFEKMMTNSNWEKWNEDFREEEGTVMLPKFKLQYEVLLNETLKGLGMPTAFKKTADFTKMVEESGPLWINSVKQKTYIDVNEKGTEAAAVTSVEMVTESAPANRPFYMEVNRPFFISITDNLTGTILFLGSISNPQEL
ncbi:serpin family protein [Bacillus dakarensis]|uniref:serpin family protein n=1 Tax=Robertmurraya dakarensis TaxID=1926278 RepID=UPI000981880A|nr:serpin family protein [Bacillus dakarensis]